MGLDMYLYAEVKAPKDSPLFKVVEEHLTSEHRASLNDPDPGNYAYISGWEYGGGPDALYKALVVETGMTPHDGSPHFNVHRDGDGYTVEATIFYWRKANHIHKWFVDGLQQGRDECERTLVHPEALMDLLERCERVTVDPSLAHELLPTQAGFFFGGTEYDEWYLADTKETAVDLKAQIALVPAGAKFYYRSSW